MSDMFDIAVLATFGLSGLQRQLLMLPLCLSIAIVYKTTRCDNVRDVPVASLILWATIVVGMYSVGVGFWVLYSILA